MNIDQTRHWILIVITYLRFAAGRHKSARQRLRGKKRIVSSMRALILLNLKGSIDVGMVAVWEVLT